MNLPIRKIYSAMQNTDYAKKLRKKKFIHASSEAITSTSKKSSISKDKKTYRSHSPENPKLEMPTISLWYVLLIGVFLFTSGLFLGMKISQKESSFASSEVQSFRNISETEVNSEQKRADIVEPESTENSENPLLSSIPKNLQFPPKLNQINYIIQLGNFSIEDANKYAASLIHERQEFQGRVFRTATGKLYLGFYYDLKEAKSVLRKIKKFQGGIFQDAEIKNIQF